MAVAKIKSGDVVCGASVVLNGINASTHDDTDRNLHMAQPSGFFFANLDGRFLAGEWAENRGVDPSTSSDTNGAPSGTDAVLYYPAQQGRQYVLFGVGFDYTTAPTSGQVLVESPSGTPVFSQDVTAAGPNSLAFPQGLRGTTGGDVLVRLKNGLAAKRVSLLGRRTE